MPAVVSNATRIWELNIHWDLFSQCGVWDPKGRGVDIWECIRAHQSTPGTQFSVVKHSLSVVELSPSSEPPVTPKRT